MPPLVAASTAVAAVAVAGLTALLLPLPDAGSLALARRAEPPPSPVPPPSAPDEALLLLSNDAAFPASPWGYWNSEHAHPGAWGSLVNASTGAPLYPLCDAAGRGVHAQSPVALADDAPTAQPAPGGATSFARTSSASRFRVSPTLPRFGVPGVVVTPSDGEATWVLDGTEFTLVNYHFHAPGEHTLNGASFALEGHFVYRSASGGLAVFGVLYPNSSGVDNAHLAAWWDHVGAGQEVEVGARTALGAADDAARWLTALLEDDLVGWPHPRFYRYDGSLTTPPCTEGVKWVVAVSSHGVSEAQRNAYAAAVGHEHTHRHPVPLGARTVTIYN
jgi:carbonic anhydrase